MPRGKPRSPRRLPRGPSGNRLDKDHTVNAAFSRSISSRASHRRAGPAPDAPVPLSSVWMAERSPWRTMMTTPTSSIARAPRPSAPLAAARLQ
eukprot:scaffold16653_cov118-Isochrysis_galbana.AAC.2